MPMPREKQEKNMQRNDRNEAGYWKHIFLSKETIYFISKIVLWQKKKAIGIAIDIGHFIIVPVNLVEIRIPKKFSVCSSS